MKQFRSFCIILLLFATGNAGGQTNSLVQYNDLVFYSDFEKEAFSDYLNGKPDYLSLFLAISPESASESKRQTEEKILKVVNEIRQKNFDKLKNEKKIQKTYNIINGSILKKFQEETIFPDLINSGVFNCLTASAYYGLIFSNLGVDFEFRESENHVHPVAFPSSTQIKVETTDPVFGFQYFNTKLKVQFVNYLIISKKISKEEANGIPVDVIFNKYYFPETSIGMKELIGLHYLNDALYNFEKGNFPFAFKQAQKAYFLYPSKRISTVMLFLLSWCINETDYSRLEEVAYLEFLNRYPDKEVEPELIIEEFHKITEKVLIQRSDITLYDEMYRLLNNSISDDSIHRQIQKEYFLEKGRILLSTFKVKDAIQDFEKVLSLSPSDIDAQMLLIQCLGLSFLTSSNEAIVDLLQDYESRFPVLTSNEGFISLELLAYLQLAEEKFDFEDAVDGELMLRKFEDLSFKNPEVGIPYAKVGDAYSSAAVYHFKRNNNKLSKDYLLRGLKIAPENYKLKYRLKAF